MEVLYTRHSRARPAEELRLVLAAFLGVPFSHLAVNPGHMYIGQGEGGCELWAVER